MRDSVKGAHSVHRRKHGYYSMYYGMIALVVIIVFALLSTTVFFRINTVEVVGSSVYSADEIVAVSGIKGGDNLVREKLKKCSERITGELAYIEEAELKRVFPSTVEIKVTPGVETASVEFEGQFYILSRSGKVLRVAEEPADDTIVVYGAQPAEETNMDTAETSAEAQETGKAEETSEKSEENSEESEEDALQAAFPVPGEKFKCRQQNRTDILYKLIEVSETAMSGKLKDFNMNDYLNISSIYDNRITIEFGSVSELDYKLRLASNIISSKIGPETEGTLKILSNGASFIDKAGIEQNEQTYLSNISGSDSSQSDIQPETDTDVTNSVTSQEVHFE